MKNIFITACYEVNNMYGNTKYEDYKKLTEICCNSFIKNLKGLTEVRVLEGKKDNFHELFKELYYKVKEIYFKNQPCNILFADSDTICLKPVTIFDQWYKFAMFNTGEEHRHSYFNSACLSLVEKLTPWMMANVRYYPAGLPNFLWETPDDLAFSWIDEWAYDAIIYNWMFHSQEIDDINNFIFPHLNYQVEGGPEFISNEAVQNASILHCHATRSSKMALEKVERALKFL